MKCKVIFPSLQTDHLCLSAANQNFPKLYQTDIHMIGSYPPFSMWVAVYESCCLEKAQRSWISKVRGRIPINNIAGLDRLINSSKIGRLLGESEGTKFLLPLSLQQECSFNIWDRHGGERDSNAENNPGQCSLSCHSIHHQSRQRYLSQPLLNDAPKLL